jgi:anti-sigma factor RsiW
MTDHLSDAILNALADGELSAVQLAGASQHLANCTSCTSFALHRSLLKSATAKAGQRYAPSPDLQERLARLTSEADRDSQPQKLRASPVVRSRSILGFESLGWAAMALVILFAVSLMVVQRATQKAGIASVENAALITEVFDLHVATLASNMAPQVVSADRHTVKPWFQGKIPFSFNLPQELPSDTTLDGANLAYLHNQPVAQLLYSIGKHHISVFLRQRPGSVEADELVAERSGFQVRGFRASDLEGIAVSDVDPVRLAELLGAIKRAQTGDQRQSK